jgi:hypothetical protein
MQRCLSVVLALALTALAVGSVAAQEAPVSISPEEFAVLSAELMGMEVMYAGGSGELVSFDAKAANASGYSADSIALAKELAAYSNELILAAQKAMANDIAGNSATLNVSLDAFPWVRAYFDAATENARNLASRRTPDGWCDPRLTDAACSCGHWWYPRPSSAAPWVNRTSSNPSNTLTSWGYHTTPDWAGGGWTRPQTYYSSRCGNNTFRDHAIITGSTTFREQNYAGYTPRGEPNPEFWAGGPWAYGAWPAYVQWWHANF